MCCRCRCKRLQKICNIHACTHTLTHTRTRARAHTHTHTHTHIHPPIHTGNHTHTQTHTHTNIREYAKREHGSEGACIPQLSRTAVPLITPKQSTHAFHGVEPLLRRGPGQLVLQLLPGQCTCEMHGKDFRAPAVHVHAGSRQLPHISTRCVPSNSPAQSRHASSPPHKPQASTYNPLFATPSHPTHIVLSPPHTPQTSAGAKSVTGSLCAITS